VSYIYKIKSDLDEFIVPGKAEFLQKYFKAFKEGYGEGDQFIGVTVPNMRKVAKKYYKNMGLEEIQELLRDEIHEYRQIALFLLVNKFISATSPEDKESIVNVYLSNLDYVNNWDLVDSSAPYILGADLYEKEDKDMLYEFAKTEHLWKQRIAILSTFYFIKNNQFDDTLNIAKILLNHKHDIIHKAVGWMLREVGNKDLKVELDFLKSHYKEMPRTMLRYAIEKFEPELRQKFLKGTL
jgi:3-methyladenine DNA glycosylase AlkD